MDVYIEYIEQLQGFIKKETQIHDVHLFQDKGDGIRGIIDTGDIDRTGDIPVRAGNEFQIKLRLIAPYGQWKVLLQKMGMLQDKLTNCYATPENQKIKLKTVVGSWIRVDDESNFIYENNLTLRVVRLNA